MPGLTDTCTALNHQHATRSVALMFSMYAANAASSASRSNKFKGVSFDMPSVANSRHPSAARDGRGPLWVAARAQWLVVAD